LTRYLFISAIYQRCTKLALFTFLLAFVVILLGAYTRLTDAGLSCPDWPHCYGYLTAPHTLSQLETAANAYPLAPVNVKKAWTEMTHRYAAGAEGLLILLLCFTLLLNRQIKDFKSSFIALSLITLLGVQVMLGMLTVTEKLKPVIVLAHLLTGLSLLSVLWWSYLDARLQQITARQPLLMKSKGWLWLALIMVVLQISLGGWVSTHYAGLACVDFPYCNGQVLPPLQWNNLNGDLITIHMLHRIGALMTALLVGGVALNLRRYTALRTDGLLILVFIALQITLGIFNIIWLRPVWIAMAHQAVGIMLLLTLIHTLVKASFLMDKRHGYFIR